LKDFWYQTASLPERLRLNGKLPTPETRISFTDTRSELQHHLEGKYGFEVFNFQNTPTDGGTPETETLRETHRSHFVIGLFDAQSGWKVPDQDPLTLTFREWRVALESPLGPATQLGDEKWLLLPNRKHVQEMMAALERTAEYLGVKDSLLILGSVAQPVQLHCVPDSFSIPESKKFAAYIFDDEVSSSNSDEPGKLHILASFGGVTELQIRRHLGNFEAAEVYSAPWGFYATVAASGMRCVYLPRCINSLGMQSKLSSAVSWLTERAQQITNLAKRRSQILGLNALPVDSPGAEKRRSKK
jgi:hypothetical protein